MGRIQIIAIIVNLIFISYVGYLIVKGKLREEYSIVWCISTALLLLFSFWRNGLAVLSKLFGIYEPPNMVFTASIFVTLIYLLHLSVVASRLHEQNKKLAQEIALIKNMLKEKCNELVKYLKGTGKDHLVIEDLGQFAKSFSRSDEFDGFKYSRMVNYHRHKAGGLSLPSQGHCVSQCRATRMGH